MLTCVIAIAIQCGMGPRVPCQETVVLEGKLLLETRTFYVGNFEASAIRNHAIGDYSRFTVDKSECKLK